MYEKWNHDSIDDFPNQDKDKEKVRRYMAENGIARPVDVWLHSLETILDLHLDAEKTWIGSIEEKVFPPDAFWMVDFFGSTYLTVCTPDSPDDEFILTENSFLISEGHIQNHIDPVTGEHSTESFTFHKLAPISPRLMFILRSNVFPEASEDAAPDVRAFQEVMQIILQSSKMTSMLEDLPVRKAINSYTCVVQGQVTPRPGWDRKYRNSDKFGFKVFRIPTRHMQKINGLLLDHAFHGSRIIFNDSEKFLNLVQWYLEEPCKVGKNVFGNNAKPLIAHIHNLITFMENNQKAIHPVVTVWPTRDISGVESVTLVAKDAILCMEKMINRDFDLSFEGTYCAFGRRLSGLPISYFADIVFLAGGTKETLPEDLEFSIEAVSFYLAGIAQASHERQSGFMPIFMNTFRGVSIARAWVFLKRLRFHSAVEDSNIRSRNDPFLYDDRKWQGLEDYLANSRST